MNNKKDGLGRLFYQANLNYASFVGNDTATANSFNESGFAMLGAFVNKHDA